MKFKFDLEFSIRSMESFLMLGSFLGWCGGALGGVWLVLILVFFDEIVIFLAPVNPLTRDNLPRQVTILLLHTIQLRLKPNQFVKINVMFIKTKRPAVITNFLILNNVNSFRLIQNCGKGLRSVLLIKFGGYFSGLSNDNVDVTIF